MNIFKSFIILLILFLGQVFSFGQSSKQIEKATKVFYKDYDKGIAKLRKYMDKADYPSLASYEVLVKMEYLDYEQSMSIWDNVSITVEGENGTNNDSLANAFVEGFKSVKLEHFIDVCRESTIQSFSYTGDLYLRILLVDINPDSTISEKGLEYFNKGEKKFVNKKYDEAEDYYRKALETDPGFYKATLYIGDSFWIRKQPDSAIYYYELAREMQPGLMEPRKYIIDALIDQGLFYRAKKECLEALCIYPGFDLKIKMQDILDVENKWLNDMRFPRGFYPNSMKAKQQSDLVGPWADYRSAMKDVRSFCNDDGIIGENSVTKDQYLEVYSFRKMLDENADNDLSPGLRFALKMKEEGYLEPYIFISMFHIDIYPQFKHYMSFEENRKKSMDYVEKYLIVKADR
ncbi:MAG: hypothetical protein R2780_04805 [Crocinitomicaceae bacterium]